MDCNDAIALIRDKGLAGLGGYDGCLCTNFMVHGIHVDVSCRKSSGMDTIFPDFFGIGIRVYSHHMDSSGQGLGLVAREVARQLKDEGYDIKARLCDYTDDKECRCTYCHKPRADLNGYLCEACKIKETGLGEKVADLHDYHKWDFFIAAPSR